MRGLLLLLAAVSASAGSAAVRKRIPAAPVQADKDQAPSSVRYRSSQEIGFDATTISGGIARPDIAIVTGNGQEGDGGLLKLRDNFTDRLALDSAEEVP